MNLLQRITMYIMIAAFIFTTQLNSQFVRHTTIDKEIQPYIDQIKRWSDNKLGNFDAIGFETINNTKEDGTEIGNCQTSIWHRDISISTKFWDTATENERYAVLIHELGHCEKDFGHNEDGLDPSFCPKHVMHPNIASEYCINRDLMTYIEQLTKDNSEQ